MYKKSFIHVITYTFSYLAAFSLIALLFFMTPISAYSQEDRLVAKGEDGITDVFKVDSYGYVGVYGCLDFLRTETKMRQMRTDAKWQQIFNMDTNNDLTLNRSPLVSPNYVSGLILGVQQRRFCVRNRTPAGVQDYLFTVLPTGEVGFGIDSPTYPLEMENGAYCSAGGVWTDASSRDYKKDIRDLTAYEAMDALEGLSPVHYSYKLGSEERYVGFISEDVPDLVATRDRKGLSPMDVVAVLTRVVKEQQKTITELSEKVAELERR